MPMTATTRKNAKKNTAPPAKNVDAPILPPLPPPQTSTISFPANAAPQGAIYQQAKGPSYSIMIAVDWENLPVQLARDAFEKLSQEYERAAKILNARTTTKPDPQFYCFMAGRPLCCTVGKVHSGTPVFTDLSYKAPKGGHKDPRTDQITPEGLVVRVDLCSVNCYHHYHALLIEERRERNNPAVNG
jgi:hypothetical protein